MFVKSMVGGIRCKTCLIPSSGRLPLSMQMVFSKANWPAVAFLPPNIQRRTNSPALNMKVLQDSPSIRGEEERAEVCCSEE